MTASRPAPFSAFTTPQFWDDPHISAQMLARHLDPDEQLASRPRSFIDRSVAWLIPTLNLTAGSRVLDLGCGPGLYAHRLAGRGIEVLGIDASRRSVEYARTVADAEALPAYFRHGDYLTDDLGDRHEAALLIYEDYCALPPDRRAPLPARTRSALRDGGRFVFDVAGAGRFSGITESSVTADHLMDGFWSDRPYTGTHERWTYPDLRLVLDRYTIEDGRPTRQFWNWMHCLTAEIVAAELAAAGFEVSAVVGDVTGRPRDPDGDAFAVVARRR